MANKRKVMYCFDCAEDTVHEKINKDVEGAARVTEAIFSLGISEITNAWNLRCTKCGKFTKDRYYG